MLTAATLWEKTLTELRNILTEVTVMNVFGQSRGVSLVDNTLTVEVSEGRPAEEIQQQWGQIILATLMKVGAPEGISAIFKEPPKEQAAQGVPEVQRDSREGSGLMEKFTFDAFVEGPSNQFPLAMAKYVAQHPGDENSHTNPLFMYGPTGVGKTHLLHAIGNLGIKVKPGLTVLYTTCERLLDDYLGMWNTEERKAAFHQKYRTPDMLLVDDIQFLSGKQGLQNEFFTIFNELTDSQKQIVMTSDRAPKDIPDLMDRLMSRFQSGVCADVDMPAYETRLNILRVKLREYGTVELSDEGEACEFKRAKPGRGTVYRGELRAYLPGEQPSADHGGCAGEESAEGPHLAAGDNDEALVRGHYRRGVQAFQRAPGGYYRAGQDA